MILYSKIERSYFKLQEELDLKEGDFLVFTHEGKKLFLDKSCILPYKISREEAQKHLQKELKQSISKFIDAVKSKTGSTNTSKEEEQIDYLDPTRLSKKIKEGTDFFKEMSEAVKVMWEAGKSDDEATQAEAKRKMQEIRKGLQAKGIPVKEDFDDIPSKLKRQQAKENKETLFQESAEKFEAATQNLFASFEEILKKYKEQSKDKPGS